MGKTASATVVVQHSGYGYGQDPQFQQGLETRQITGTQAEVKTKVLEVLVAGGVVFGDYSRAEAYTEREMFPADHGSSMIPGAKGTFASLHIDGLAVYRPSGVQA